MADTEFGPVDKDGKVMVRNVFRPHEEYPASVHEAAALKRKKLLYEGTATTDEGATKAVEKQQVAARGLDPKTPTA
jgi:hypothetical protein